MPSPAPPLADLINHTLQSASGDVPYLSRHLEREFLTMALGKGITVDLARTALLDACREKGILVESAVLRDARHNLAQLAANGSRISESGFLGIVQEAVRRSRENLSEKTVKAILVEIIEDNEYPLKTDFLKANWLERIKGEVCGK